MLFLAHFIEINIFYRSIAENCYLCAIMAKKKRYILNPITLIYEVEKASRRSRVLKSLAFFIASLGLAVLYFWLYTSVLDLELPKTLLLKKTNAELVSRAEVLNRQLDVYDESLSALQMRDDGIYRSIFGMNEIPSEVRNAGFGGVNRYAHYDENAEGSRNSRYSVWLSAQMDS